MYILCVKKKKHKSILFSKTALKIVGGAEGRSLFVKQKSISSLTIVDFDLKQKKKTPNKTKTIGTK